MFATALGATSDKSPLFCTASELFQLLSPAFKRCKRAGVSGADETG